MTDHTFRLYDTQRRATVPFEPAAPGVVRLYFCGMTVYDHAHVGHARMMVVADAFVRYLRARGWRVEYVRNYTDVDDKIIARAHALGEDPLALASRYVDAFREDMDALGLVPPDREPRVTESIGAILAMIRRLVDRGHAYEAEGSVWFSVGRAPDYGSLSRQRPEDLRASADAAAGKRDPRDFVLWKAAKPGEPAWTSPWGLGRPGWHIECSAMVRETLGDGLDIHGGGLDLVFPHHENELAQATAADPSAPYARYWMHNGLLTTDTGAKIARSEGNGSTIREVLTRVPAEVLRLYYLQVHYRSPLPWNDAMIPDALRKLARLYDAREAAAHLAGEGAHHREEDSRQVAKTLGEDAERVLDLVDGFEARLHAALDEDFNTARALASAFELARAVNRLAGRSRARTAAAPIARRALAAFALVTTTLGLLRDTRDAFQEQVKAAWLPRLGLHGADVEQVIVARSEARRRRDFAMADALRQKLRKSGIHLRDAADGTHWWVDVESAGG